MKQCKRCENLFPLDAFPKRLSGKSRVCKKCNYALVKKWREENIAKRLEQNKRRYKKYKNKILCQNRVYTSKRRKIDDVFDTRLVLGTRLSIMVNRISKNKPATDKRIEQILGIEYKSFKNYLENLLQPEMTWDNYNDVWHVGHIVPCKSAKTMEEMILRFHFLNLRPENKKDNIRKGGKTDKEYINWLKKIDEQTVSVDDAFNAKGE